MNPPGWSRLDRVVSIDFAEEDAHMAELDRITARREVASQDWVRTTTGAHVRDLTWEESRSFALLARYRSSED